MNCLLGVKALWALSWDSGRHDPGAQEPLRGLSASKAQTSPTNHITVLPAWKGDQQPGLTAFWNLCHSHSFLSIASHNTTLRWDSFFLFFLKIAIFTVLQHPSFYRWISCLRRLRLNYFSSVWKHLGANLFTSVRVKEQKSSGSGSGLCKKKTVLLAHSLSLTSGFSTKCLHFSIFTYETDVIIWALLGRVTRNRLKAF